MHFRAFGPAQQHRLIAASAPRLAQCVIDDGRPKSALSIVRVGHDILDERVRPAAAREIRDDDKATRRNERARLDANDAPEARTAQHRLPGFLSLRAVRDGIVGRVEMAVKLEEIGKVARSYRSNFKFLIWHLLDPCLPNALRLAAGGAGRLQALATQPRLTTWTTIHRGTHLRSCVMYREQSAGPSNRDTPDSRPLPKSASATPGP